MLLGDFQTWFGQSILIMAMVVGFSFHLLKRFLGNNEQIKSAAKDAVTDKAISMIGKFLK